MCSQQLMHIQDGPNADAAGARGVTTTTANILALIVTNPLLQ